MLFTHNSAVTKTNSDLFDRVSSKTGAEKDLVRQVAEELLAGLHKRLKEADSDYIGQVADYDLGDRGYYHLLGLLEQFSKKYEWDAGTAGQYLGRMPPMERWKPHRDEMDKWSSD